MNSDIVFPKENEEEFLEIAGKLGYNSLIFVYEKSAMISKNISELSKKYKIKIQTALVVEEKQIQKAKKDVSIVFVKSTGNDRWVFEKSQADVIYGLEAAQRKDFIHHRASGLNQVLCKIASVKGKKIGFDFSTVLNSKGMLRAQIIGRMMQNVKFCRKYKVKTVLESFAKNPYEMRAPKDLEAFGKIIGL